ncbi:MAG: nucleobase:cation symporter-2 family protein [Eubacteriales bacterium]|nr:nucleobase:cation symporter-2 family protein [Eubacteriales bacterium]
MKMQDEKAQRDAFFTMDGKPSVLKSLPVAFQHVLAMIIGNIAPAIIVAGALGLSSTDKAVIIQYAMMAAGIGTLVQVFGFGPVGSRLPLIMGLNFAFVPVIITIGSNYGFSAVFASMIFGGLAVILFGASIMKIRRFFPPLVTGTTVLAMGISLYPVAINYMAGGVGEASYGDWKNWLVALVTLAVVFILSEFGRGYIKVIAILIGIVVGYVLALPLGLVSFDGVSEAGVFALPAVLPFGMTFHPGAIFTMVIMYLVASVEIIGDISSLTIGGMEREATDREISGGIIGNGISSVIVSFFGGLPMATFSQNVGIVATTKVVSKRIISITGIIILATGFLPKFGAVMSTIPNAVLGGATLSVFAIISINGIRLIAKEPFTMRNCNILGIALAVGIGIAQVPAALDKAPVFFRTFFGSSPVIIATLIVFILNLIVPKKSFEREEEERRLKR